MRLCRYVFLLFLMGAFFMAPPSFADEALRQTLRDPGTLLSYQWGRMTAIADYCGDIALANDIAAGHQQHLAGTYKNFPQYDLKKLERAYDDSFLAYQKRMQKSKFLQKRLCDPKFLGLTKQAFTSQLKGLDDYHKSLPQLYEQFQNTP